ncbi:glycosyltransferase family 2 protein [Mesorhizobium sp. BE184]|uniref:glycosyltransferase family 2 protein n=1 Tax=Mesorhizobium sp. BE184 TaxID=2817714 RepID=UPI00285A6426|nr:glycosyltransferase family 2 protein [Mesorhizobium sp. BE184]MDR7034857.1 glycosyltransferase involved in cell wall biosynthesis [Mesorhizobium sp. BE184]
MATEVSRAEGALALSAFIICLNEEAYLGNCIESLDVCSDIVIVDSGSTDGTLFLIQTYIERGWPIRLFSEPWRGYAGQKQYALEQCREDWCFNIDADERFDEPLKEVLPHLLKAEPGIVGWRIARRPYLIGYGYTPRRVHERRNLRLIRRGHGSYDLSQKVHEGIRPDGKVENALQGSLLHFRPLVMDEQILKENKYSSLKADQLVAAGTKPRRIKLLFNPPVYFLRLYLRNGLWRCGFPGFIEAMTGAVYSFLTEAKIYQSNALRDRPSMDAMDRADKPGPKAGA